MDVASAATLDDLSCFTYDFVDPKPGPSKRPYTDDICSASKKAKIDSLKGQTAAEDDLYASDAFCGDHDAGTPKETTNEEPIVRYRQVLRFKPVSCPYVSVTMEDGNRAYLRLFDQGLGDMPVVPAAKKSASLLPVGFFELRKQASLSKTKFHETLADVLDLDDIRSGAGGDDLWVEKYRPKSYMDLLSEETLNHNLLHWLKLWDKTVYGNDYLAKYKELKGKYLSIEQKEKEKETYFSHKVPHAEDDNYDDIGRPKQKIALLHGPPGFGKTTCAHVVARHAGYKVIELNASDDRSAEVFRKTLDCTTQMRPEVFQDGRPNCLIIDEIDGAPADAVNVLVDLVTGKATEKGKNKTKKILRRPIICICNDLYAVALKNLKPHCFILQFQPVSVNALIDRMKDISFKENLTMDSSTLHTLCERTQYDLRSCLSSLQFLKKCKPGGGSVGGLLNQIAKPDKHKGLFTVWDEIFFLPQPKKNCEGEDTLKPSVRFHSILKTVQNFGDYGKLFDGVFQNYLQAKSRDSYFQTLNNGMKWAQWFEEIQTKIDRSQNYSLFPYLPVYFVNAHFQFATRNKFALTRPNIEHKTRITKTKQILRSQTFDMSPNVGKFVNDYVLILEILPNLLTIIQPGNIRPIPMQLWNTRERETVSEIVSTMISYNLAYAQTKQADGAWTYTLEPNIEEICRFNLKDCNRTQFLYTVKQLVAREISMEKLRRSEFTTPENSSESSKGAPMDEATQHPEEKKTFSRQSSSADVLKVSPPSSAKQPFRASFQPKDFFGRPIIRKEQVSEEKQQKESDVWYRYKEGYSNAVRKNVKLKDFL